MWLTWLVASVVAEELQVCWTKCYDGDTCTFDLFNPTCAIPDVFAVGISVRLLGVDTPELRGECRLEKCLGTLAKEFVVARLKDSRVKLAEVQRDKYFRLLANILYNPTSEPLNGCRCEAIDISYPNNDWHRLSTELLEAKLAVEYFGATKETDWCDYSSRAFYSRHTRVCLDTDACVQKEFKLSRKLKSTEC